jgi:hypothetical protein
VKTGEKKMKRITAASLLVTGLLALSACSLFAASSDGGIVDLTADQQTQVGEAVQQTQAAGADPLQVPPATDLPLPEAPTVSVSVGTNCRTGPGEPYDIVGMLNVGETAEVIGRNEYGDTWIIRLPSNPSVTCWLWGNYATVSGDTSGLTVYSVPPTPTPAVGFTFSYLNMYHCAPIAHGFEFQVTNTGSLTWESFQLEVTDLTTSQTKIYADDQFVDITNTCTLASALGALAPGVTGVAVNLGAAYFTYNPTGHTISATARLCSENGLGGMCVDKMLSFTP